MRLINTARRGSPQSGCRAQPGLLVALVGRSTCAAAHLVQALRQALGLMHLKVQEDRLWIGRFTINQLIAGRVPSFGGTVLNKAARRDMRRGLAKVCAYADAINRHGSKLSTAKKANLAEVTICILECLDVLRSRAAASA
jgi:hypothetical protein